MLWKLCRSLRLKFLNLHWMSARADDVAGLLMPFVSVADPFFLFCFRRIENHRRENQTRFCSLSLTTPPPPLLPPLSPLVSRKRTLRNLPDLFTEDFRSFFTVLDWLRPHLHVSNFPPMAGCHFGNFLYCHNIAALFKSQNNWFTQAVNAINCNRKRPTLTFILDFSTKYFNWLRGIKSKHLVQI